MNQQQAKYVLLVGHESLKLRRALSLVLRVVVEDEVDIGRKFMSSSSEGRSVMVRDTSPYFWGMNTAFIPRDPPDHGVMVFMTGLLDA